jgi:hypothetical protein
VDRKRGDPIFRMEQGSPHGGAHPFLTISGAVDGCSAELDWHDPLSTQSDHLLMRWCGAYAIFKVLTGLRDDHVDRRRVR